LQKLVKKAEGILGVNKPYPKRVNILFVIKFRRDFKFRVSDFIVKYW
jgi:hypothetical protein